MTFWVLFATFLRMKYDLAIVGIGSHGSATLHRAAQEGLKVIGIDRFNPPHDKSSHHGETRITREAQFEGDHLVKIVQAGNTWRKTFEDAPDSLFVKTGCLNIGPKAASGERSLPELASSVAKRCGLEIEIVDTALARKRFPAFEVPEDWEMVYEPNGGFLRPEACIAKNIEQARKYGAEVLVNTEVTGIESGCVTLSDGARIEANQIILSAGPYVKKFIPANISKKITPVRIIAAWFKIKENYEIYKNMPVFLLDIRKVGLFGFPAIDGPDGGVKIGVEVDVFNQPEIDPTKHSSAVAPEEVERIFGDSLKYFPGLSFDYVRSAGCIYSVVPDAEFIIDKHPTQEGVWICSACSGHGFKLCFGIGLMLTELVKTGKSDLYTDKFKFSRFY